MKTRFSIFFLVLFLSIKGKTQSIIPKQLSKKFRIERVLSKTTYSFVGNNGKKGIIDINGDIICNPIFSQIENQFNSLITVSNDTLLGVADLKGRLILPYNFDELRIISKNRFEVYKNGVAFIIDSTNKYVGPLKSIPATPHYSNLIQFIPPKIINDDIDEEPTKPRFEKEGSTYFLLKNEGKISTDFKDLKKTFVGDILIYKAGSKFGLVNDTGLILTKAIYNEIKPLNDNLLLVTINENKGMISYNGDIVLPVIFSKINSFDVMGNAIIKKFTGHNNHVGVINKSGKIILPLQEGEIITSEMSDINQGIYVFTSRTSKNVYDRFLKSIIPDGFIVTRVYEHNIYVSNGKQSGIVNEAGYFTFLINAVQLEPFENSNNKNSLQTYLFLDSHYKWGLISGQKKIIITPQYENIRQLSNGMAIVESKKKYGLVSDDGKISIPVIYDDISTTACKGKIEGEYISCCYIVKLGDNQGLLNANNLNAKIIFFESIDGNFLQGLALAKQGKKYGYINNKGEIIIPFEFDWAGPFYKETTEVIKEGKKKRIDKRGKVIEDIF